MKSIQYFFILFLLFYRSIHANNQINFPITIITPIPLLQNYFQNQNKNNIATYLKQYAMPLTLYFYYKTSSNNIITDMTSNPWTTLGIIYIINCYMSLIKIEEEQKKIDQDILDMMQHVFQILIIGCGIHNKIIKHHNYKTSINIQVSTFTALHQLLYNAYNSWLILFSYYEEHAKQEQLFYIYKTNQIDIFEMTQVCNKEPDLLPLINQLHHNDFNYNYEPILNCLELRLKLINHRINNTLPSSFRDTLTK